MTELRRFTEAYATMTVAAYEPLMLRWVSLLGLHFIANSIADRQTKAAAVAYDGTLPIAWVLNRTVRTPIPRDVNFRFDEDGVRVPIDIYGNALKPGEARKVDVRGFPNAAAVGKDVYLGGFSTTDAAPLSAQDESASTAAGARLPLTGGSARSDGSIRPLTAIPLTVASRLGRQPADYDFVETRDAIQANLVNAAKAWVADPGAHSLSELMLSASKVDGVSIPHAWPAGSGSDGWSGIIEALSPIGIAHYFRQLYFNKEEGVGPVEECFTVAPKETLEVIYQTVRKQTHEEVLQQGLETISESAVEEKNLDEVSDKVSSMVQQDISTSMSANVGGSVGVWQVGVSGSADFANSSQRSREYSTRRLKETTTRASERITKSFSIKTTDTTEVTEASTTRRVIKNEGENPVNYGLRRVLRRVNVKVQDLGPRLVWQIYLSQPGAGLARSRFVHFREAAPLTVPDLPPGVPPRPKGGSETESTTAVLKYDGVRRVFYVTIVIKPGSDRRVTGVRIENITDLESGGKDDRAPAPANDVDLGSAWDPATQTYTANIGISPGDSHSFQVAYGYTWEPSDAVLADWEAQRATAAAAATQAALTEQFEQHKTLIAEKSKIRSRPANDLRMEERYEVMNRMVSYLFGRGDSPSEPSPIEIEYFHRYFDIEGIFTYNHPSWWKPRAGSSSARVGRDPYEISAESEPAPLGASLGWLIQLDGDRRRNEFLNSPWARVCLPLRPGREREAIAWLAMWIEGDLGYDPDQGKLADLLTQIEVIRNHEQSLGLDGADWVTVDAAPTSHAGPAKPEGVYPVVDQFDVTLPTTGFVYDVLKVVIE